MPDRKSHLDSLAISLLLACCLFWGLQQILIKTTVGEVPPLWQASLRFAGATALLWLWCVFIIAFFSLSQSKLAPYVLPVMPALALLTALEAPRGSIRGLWFGALALLPVSLALLVAGLWPAWVSSDAYIAEVVERTEAER